MRKAFIILIIFSILSCKQKDECYPEFKESLAYLKEFSDPNDKKSRFTDEIFRNIEIVESTSGILNKHRGDNLIRHIVVTQKDIDKWEKWIVKKCDSINQKNSN